MTLKQGEEINKKFSDLKDTISLLNKKIIEKDSDFSKLNSEKLKLDSSNLILNHRLDSSGKEIFRLNNYVVEQDKEFWRERRQGAIWMLVSFVFTVIVAVIK